MDLHLDVGDWRKIDMAAFTGNNDRFSPGSLRQGCDTRARAGSECYCRRVCLDVSFADLLQVCPCEYGDGAGYCGEVVDNLDFQCPGALPEQVSAEPPTAIGKADSFNMGRAGDGQADGRRTALGEPRGSDVSHQLVQDKATKEPLDEAGRRVYQKAFAKGLAWIPAGHILRMSPPVVMEDEVLLKGLDMIDEAIGETERELGYGG